MASHERIRALANNELFVVLCLFIIALALRLLGISYQSIGLDEGSTFFYSHYTWDEFKVAHEPNSPIYYMMEGVVIDVLGQTEFGLRFTSAIAGALSIPLAYYLTKRVVGNYAVSVLVAIIFVISPSCLYYSQEARAYSIVLFLFLCQAHTILYALNGKRWCWILFSVLSAAAFAMQYVSIVATFTLYVYAICHYRNEIHNREYRKMTLMFVSAILFFILTLPLMSLAFETFMLRSSSGPDNLCIGPIYLAVFIYWDLFRSVIFGIIMTLCIILGAKVCLKRNPDAAIFLLVITMVPMSITTMLSFIGNMNPRYIFWSLPGFYTLAACCLLKDGLDKESVKKYAKKAAIVLTVACLVCLPYYYINICKEDFRGGCAALDEVVQPGDAVIYAPNWENAVYACISFYNDTTGAGVTYIGANTQEQVEAILDDPTYNNVYILIYDEQDPYKWVSGLPDTECKHIYHAYWMDVYKFTSA